MTQDDVDKIGELLDARIRPLQEDIRTLELKIEQRFNVVNERFDTVEEKIEGLTQLVDGLVGGDKEHEQRIRRLESRLNLPHTE